MPIDKDWTPPATPEALDEWLEGLTFHPEIPVAPEDMPPVLAEGEDVMVPRSFKIPVRLDQELQRLATQHGITKSEMIRQYLEQAVAAELAAEGTDVLVSLADVLRVLTSLRQLPRSA